MDAIRWALLGSAAAIVVVSCIGLFAVRGVFDRLHMTGPASTLPPALIALAVVLDESPTSAGGIKALLVAVILLALNPVLVHATARAAIVRQHGRWTLVKEDYRPEEEDE